MDNDNNANGLPPMPLQFLRRQVRELEAYPEHDRALDTAHRQLEQNNDLTPDQVQTARNELARIARFREFVNINITAFQDRLNAIISPPTEGNAMTL